MNTQININKSLYIARPKKTDNVSNEEQEVLYTNKLIGKPYIAYPKNGSNKPKSIAEKVDLQEGLYVAYPRQEEPAEDGENTFSRLYRSENYLGLPERRRWSARKEYSLSVYSSLFKSKWSINSLCQLFKAKVS